MLGANYRTVEPAEVAAAHGRVARYAWGTDYHVVIRDRLRRLAECHRRLTPGVLVRGVVDTAPLLERQFAQLAGLGWIGKNTLLVNDRFGSWLFLAALLTSAELDYDEPFAASRCGACRACLDACPTGALVDAYRLDARKCISYLTIELKGAIPHKLRPGLGEWLFGCDVCQQVCPWNHRTPVSPVHDFAPAPGLNPAALVGLFDLDEEAFRRRFRHTSLWRAGRRGLLRNAAVVLGNQRDLSSLPALLRGLHDQEALVRGACAWALGQLSQPQAQLALREQLASERDPLVRAEIQDAIAKAEPG